MVDPQRDTAAGRPIPFQDGAPAPGRCLVMGILNVTPDSFSDGGRHHGTRRAVRHGLRMAADGADLVDVGGESTRPGARPVPQDEERARVVPVVRELVLAGVPVSVDTMHAGTARAAVDAGACMVNDVSGGLADPAMAATVAAAGVSYVAVRWRAPSRDMDRQAVYGDVVAEVTSELLVRVDRLVTDGVDPGRLILDPGLGFAKRARHDWRLLAHLHALRATGFPVLVGASRKRFLGAALGDRTGREGAPGERDAATAAVSALAAGAGAACVRVHDVRSSLHAVCMSAAWTTAAN
ncbi:dihydropteroate synthase [Streptomyces sp. NPDC050560]|uniref:dihydropteroate synthase n=1 Tax=Streptomyces sp. NPDC050560 TaxID=3365630 RepID=UPI00378DA531